MLSLILAKHTITTSDQTVVLDGTLHACLPDDPIEQIAVANVLLLRDEGLLNSKTKSSVQHELSVSGIMSLPEKKPAIQGVKLGAFQFPMT